MASLAQKIRAEHQMRELLREADLPEPAAVEYGYTCVRFFFEPQMVCVIVDLDDPGDVVDLDDPVDELDDGAQR